MTNIVVGIDGSESAAAALRWAVREAEVRSASVTAILAWGLLNQHHPDREERFDPDYDSASARRALSAYVDAALRGEATPVELRPVCDLPARALLDAAVGADLLVVGGRGLGGFKGLLLGSVSSQCLHHATCPVAVIRDEDETTPAPPTGRLVVGIDGSPTSLRALRWAVDEARARNASLEVVHAWTVAYPGGDILGGVAVDPQVFKDGAQATLDNALEVVDLGGLEHPVGTLLPCASAATALIQASKDADLVVMGTRGLGGFAGLLLGSTTNQVVHHATSPVVVVPGAGDDEP